MCCRRALRRPFYRGESRCLVEPFQETGRFAQFRLETCSNLLEPVVLECKMGACDPLRQEDLEWPPAMKKDGAMTGDDRR